MKPMKCSNGHLYDGDVYSACPHCKNAITRSESGEEIPPTRSVRDGTGFSDSQVGQSGIHYIDIRKSKE